MGAHLLAAGLPGPGEVLDGKYRLLGVIGEGGMGVVFEATHLRLGQRVAIKMLQPELAANADVVSRFEREARAAGRLRGRHVARVSDVEVSAGKLPYMVMEFLEGHDLATELERRGRLSVEEAVEYALQAARGIAEAHDAGIVHRDLKPSNLFLCDEGDQRVVKLLDFGISKMADEASKLTTTQLTVGTLLYMSPEQVRSAKTVDRRTDIWSLGVILYELLAGDPPFVGSGPAVAAAIVADATPSLAEARPDLPPELVAVVERALAKNAADRFPDVTAFAAALAPFGPAGAFVPTSGAFSLRLRAAPPPTPAPTPPPRLVDEHAETQFGNVPLVGATTSAPVDASSSLGAPLAAKRSSGRSVPAWVVGSVLGVAVLASAVAFSLAHRHPPRAPDPVSTAGASVGPATRASAATPPADTAPALAPTPPADTAPAPATTPVSSASEPTVPTPSTKTATKTASSPKGGRGATSAAAGSAIAPPAPPTPAPKKRDEKPPLVAPF